jgi:hypothetical protein
MKELEVSSRVMVILPEILEEFSAVAVVQEEVMISALLDPVVRIFV